MSNFGSLNALEDTIGSVLGGVGIDPRIQQHPLKTLMESNDGPAKTAAKITGVQSTPMGEKDTDPYFTNNEGIPWPDPAHSLNVGGIPVVSDTFLMQKQQTFNRSKTLESRCFVFHLMGCLCF